MLHSVMAEEKWHHLHLYLFGAIDAAVRLDFSHWNDVGSVSAIAEPKK